MNLSQFDWPMLNQHLKQIPIFWSARYMIYYPIDVSLLIFVIFWSNLVKGSSKQPFKVSLKIIS